MRLTLFVKDNKDTYDKLLDRCYVDFISNKVTEYRESLLENPFSSDNIILKVWDLDNFKAMLGARFNL